MLPVAATHGNPGLFAAIPAADTDTLLAQLGIPVAAPATVYGSGLAPEAPWSVSTAEI
ncbi:hypothetical protein ACFUJR_36145 [Streptomyces sp. NPDC057271]|uniref:hypothetical protein n=1 Tax=unclassified Streptomyces TaxID=2593676 RepID=UPI003635B5BE